jgi:hypothetical protein
MDLIGMLDTYDKAQKAVTHWEFTDIDTGEVIHIPVKNAQELYPKMLKQGHKYQTRQVNLAESIVDKLLC